MDSLFSQTLAVIKMNVLSISRRIWMSLAMVLASAIVVAILLAFLAMARGFERTLQGAGEDLTAIFLREGSVAELNSVISRNQINLIRSAPGIRKDKSRTMLSPELYVIVDGIKKTTQTEANISLRGITKEGLKMRQDFQILSGRTFTPGTYEMIVGVGLIGQFDGFELAKEITLGKTKWRVVGTFSSGGSVFESELWADLRVLQNLYNRGGSVQIVRAKVISPTSIKHLRDFIQNDPRLNVEVQTERDYFTTQSKGLEYMAIFGQIISFVMALGALAGALNTMYTSVADRSKEIATLRTIGFSNSSAFIGTIAEALVLSSLGGIIGTFATYTFFDGITTATLGGNFTQVVFSFELSSDLIMQGIQLALLIGLLSGIFPAWRAARTPVVFAFMSDH